MFLIFFWVVISTIDISFSLCLCKLEMIIGNLWVGFTLFCGTFGADPFLESNLETL